MAKKIERAAFLLSAAHPTGGGNRFRATATTVTDIEKDFASIRAMYADYNVTVHNTNAGLVHTFKSSEAFDLRFIES